MSKDKDNKAQIKNEFMIHMYDQMFSTIDRSYKNIWNLIYIVGGGFGVLTVYNEVPTCKSFVFDIAFWGYMIGLVWILFRLIDANYWLNRNLFFISNIENVILKKSASKIFKGFRGEIKTNSKHTSLRIEKIFIQISIFVDCISYLYVRCDGVLSILVVVTFWLITLFSVYHFSCKRNEDFLYKIKETKSQCDEVENVNCPIIRFISEMF